MDIYQPQLQFGKKVFEPGVYDLSNEEYHSSVGISRSAICEFLKTPYHFFDKYTNDRTRLPYIQPDPEEEPENNEKALLIGNALHTYVLERSDFWNRFTIHIEIDKRNNDGKELAKQIEIQTKGMLKLTEKVFLLVKNIAKAISCHEDASRLIKNSVYEKSVYWIDEDTGLLCKARPDIWHSKYIADIKTTACAAEIPFSNSIYSYGYHLQGAMIFDALKYAAHEEHDAFVFIAAEKKRPFAVATYELHADAVAKGIFEYKEALKGIKRCMENNSWPGYTHKIIDLPFRAYRN